MKLKHYLIASPENHYQPWITSKTAMAVFVVSVWTLRMFLPDYLAVSAPGIDPADLLSRVNSERTNRFIPALVTDPKLSAAANIKSADMIERSYFAHVNPDGDYVWPVIEAQGYKPYKALGENLAIDFTSGEAVVNAWMNSPGHRANILNDKFEDQGMAAVYGEFEPNHFTYAITNLFGALLNKSSPAPAPPPQQTPPPQPSPLPVPQPTPPAQSPSPSPTPTPAPTPAPATHEATSEPKSETEIPVTSEISPSGDNIVTGAQPETPDVIATEQSSLISLKVVIMIFAAVYTIFLGIDSIIIHQARVRRENISSSQHTLMLMLISAVNFITLLW